MKNLDEFMKLLDLFLCSFLFDFMPFRVQKRTKKGSQSLGPMQWELSAYETADDWHPALLETTESLKSFGVYALKGAQTDPNSFFDCFFGARLHEMAKIVTCLLFILNVNPFGENNKLQVSPR